MEAEVDLDPTRIAEILLSWKELQVTSCNILQTLWSGYGFICNITARPIKSSTAVTAMLDTYCPKNENGEYPLILKIVTPPQGEQYYESEGHMRKMLSYQVEQFFYDKVAPLLLDNVPVAKYVASTRDRDDIPALKGVMASVITDLRTLYPVMPGKRDMLSHERVHAALGWLGRFHGESWNYLPMGIDDFILPPLDEAKYRSEGGPQRTNLWRNGGYTYLATRRQEYDNLEQNEDSEWSDKLCCPIEGSKSVAELVADFLAPRGRRFEVFVHGDVKSENMVSDSTETKIAMFDFQYIGLGMGVSDLAKLFTCSVPLDMLLGAETPRIEYSMPMCDGERSLLWAYWHTHLKPFADAAGIYYSWNLFVRHWEAALVDWLRFQASWGFWGNTEWLEARVRLILQDQSWWDWLDHANDHDGTGPDGEGRGNNHSGDGHNGAASMDVEMGGGDDAGAQTEGSRKAAIMAAVGSGKRRVGGGGTASGSRRT
jgi:hypothetical protein